MGKVSVPVLDIFQRIEFQLLLTRLGLCYGFQVMAKILFNDIYPICYKDVLSWDKISDGLFSL